MLDFEVGKNWRILVAIAERNCFQTVARRFPRLTQEQYASYREFVGKCQVDRRNAWKRWTHHDEATLRRLFNEPVPIRYIAVFLGRSSNAVCIRLRQIGLLPGQQSNRTQRRAS